MINNNLVSIHCCVVIAC